MSTLAVMGMSKNTGKTVVLNHLLAQAAAAGVHVGVTSIGRDGEARDEVFFIPKPPVVVWPDTLVATARDTLRRARLRWKQLAATGIDTPLGEILIVRALDHGEMEIAGASHGAGQQKLIERLKHRGAALVLLDGALGRSQHASPALADGVILATGAALGGGIADVIRKTRERLAMLGIDEADGETAARCREVFAEGGVGVWDRSGAALFRARISTLNAASTLLRFAATSPLSPCGRGAGGISANLSGSSPFKGEVRWGMGLGFAGPGPIPTPPLPLHPSGCLHRKGREKGAAALKLARMGAGGEEVAAIAAVTDAPSPQPLSLGGRGACRALTDCEPGMIAVSGAVGRALWQAIMTLATHHRGLTVVVADGTRLFIEHADLAAFRQLGGRLLAQRGIRVAGVTLNPFSPLGAHFDAEEFLVAARAAFPDHHVSDVVRERQALATGVAQ